MDGEIKVQSDPGLGTLFEIKLFSEVAENELNFSEIVKPGSLENIKVRYKVSRYLKVIVADVNRNHEKHLIKELEEMNCAAIRCTSGIEVLDKFEQNPDLALIIISTNYSDMNSLKLSSEIRRVQHHYSEQDIF